MAKRKNVHHGSKRMAAKSKAFTASTVGAQSFDVSDADLIKVSTVASACGTQVTVNITDIYEGQTVHVDFDSNDACDTLVVTLNGTSSSVDIATAVTANQRSLSRVVVLDSASESEKGSQELANGNI